MELKSIYAIIEATFITCFLIFAFIFFKYINPYFEIINSCEKYFSEKVRISMKQFRLQNLTTMNYSFNDLQGSNCTCIYDMPFDINPT